LWVRYLFTKAHGKILVVINLAGVQNSFQLRMK
jgi:hypothetical protein